MNRYIAFYKGKTAEVSADTPFVAQAKAAKLFNTKKTYNVAVRLVSRGSAEVKRDTAELPGS